MTRLNDEMRELTIDELDQVSGGVMGLDDVIISVGIGLVANAMSNVHGISDSINYIKQQAGK
jgi:bacteriocin-like protein